MQKTSICSITKVALNTLQCCLGLREELNPHYCNIVHINSLKILNCDLLNSWFRFCFSKLKSIYLENRWLTNVDARKETVKSNLWFSSLSAGVMVFFCFRCSITAFCFMTTWNMGTRWQKQGWTLLRLLVQQLQWNKEQKHPTVAPWSFRCSISLSRWIKQDEFV